MIKLFKDKNIFLTWFFSYVVILSVTMAMSLYTFYQTEKSLIAQNEINQEELLENKRQYVDNILLSASNAAIEISLNRQAEEFARDSQGLTSGKKYKMLSLKDYIENFKSIDTNIGNIYIYFPNYDFVVGNSSSNETENFFHANYSGFDIAYEQWLELLNTKNTGRYVSISKEGQSRTMGNVLYINSVVANDNETPLMNICIELSYEALCGKVNQDDTGKHFYVTDSEQNIVIADKFFETERFNTILKNNANLLQSGQPCYLDDEVILLKKSMQNDWSYIYVIEKSSYMSNISRNRSIFTILFVLCMVLGITVSYALAKKNHKPIKRLMTKLGGSLDYQKGTDQFEYIDNVISKILEENSRRNNLELINNNVIRDAIFDKLIKGNNVSSLPVTKVLEGVDIHFSFDNYYLVIYDIDDVSGIFFEKDTSDTEEKQNLARLIICNILSDLFDDRFIITECEIDGALCNVINTKNENAAEEISAIIRKAQKLILENFNIEFIAAISAPHGDINELSQCYNEAEECMESAFVEFNGVISYADIKGRTVNRYYYPIEKEMQIIAALKKGEYDNGIKIINEVIDKNMKNKEMSIPIYRCLMCDIAATMAKTVSETKDIDGSYAFELVSAISDMKNFNSMRTQLTAAFEKLCRKKKECEMYGSEDIIENVKNFVNQNYVNCNLSVLMISDYFDMNLSYMSSLFKKQTGIGLLTYITDIRIEKAKEILRNSDDTLDVIAEKVGYTNVRTFSRIFMKSVGKTPGTYRKDKENE